MKRTHPGLGWMIVAVTISLSNAGRIDAEDWEQWRGKDRLAVWRDKGIMDQFPEQGLTTTWSVKIGAGYSGPVVSDGKVITMDYRPPA